MFDGNGEAEGEILLVAADGILFFRTDEMLSRSDTYLNCHSKYHLFYVRHCLKNMKASVCSRGNETIDM